MHPFLLALSGGILIGLAATLLLLVKGRVMGVSGIVSGILPPLAAQARSDVPWRLSFIAGAIAAPLLVATLGMPVTQPEFGGGTGDIVFAGLLVGAGTVIGSGCTSGHGVCGLARLSRRSLVATLVFMLVAMLTVWFLRTLRG